MVSLSTNGFTPPCPSNTHAKTASGTFSSDPLMASTGPPLTHAHFRSLALRDGYARANQGMLLNSLAKSEESEKRTRRRRVVDVLCNTVSNLHY